MRNILRRLTTTTQIVTASWLSLLLGLGLALILAVVWLHTSPAELVTLIASLLVTGLLSISLGIAGVTWLRRGRVPIWLQVALTALFGMGVALCNILITAQLMFISTSDLPLLALLMLVAAVIAAGLSVALSRVFAQRISALQQGAAALSTGDLTTRVTVEGADELAALAEAFNHMADQLAGAAAERERQEAARRDLIAAISHDLRTPLASLRVMTEALADGVVDDAATTARYYSMMRIQIGQINQLIEDLFNLARLDAGALELELLPIAPDDLAADALAGMSPQAAAKGVELVAEVAPDLPPALVAPQQIVRVFDNLLANALRHTPAGGRVRLTASLTADARCIQFVVSDTGEGIAEADLPHVFERFYRGEKSRSRASGGSGLGLAIALGIVRAHGGAIQIASVPHQGTQVTFTVRRA